MRIILLLLSWLLMCLTVVSQNTIEIELMPNEKIWSGAIRESDKMPFPEGYLHNFYATNNYNQVQPLLLSNMGLYVWSEEPFAFEVLKNRIVIRENFSEVLTGRKGSTLREARAFASNNFFPPSGKMPDILLFEQPQYNTWIELTYNQNQTDILNYAQSIIDNGFPPGVFMIDDTWQEDYGLWEFHPGRFPDPKKMISQLKEMGFKVMLWVCPFISADQALVMRDIMKDKGLLMHKTHEHTTWETAKDPAIIKWWNGYSALLDFTNPGAVKWFNNELDRLIETYGIDGFKFDAGDFDFYPDYALSKYPASPNRHAELYAQFGLRFPLNEYRACWKMAGQPLAQRLHDKQHNWEDVQTLISQMLVEGLVGYTFSCPDMIGGGEFLSFLDLERIDQDLVVRSAQIHALMPMMQFSVAPWRILDAKHFEVIKNAVAIRETYVPTILELAKKSAITGEPIVSSLEYVFPNQGFENVSDQFMLGENILVAPIITNDNNRDVKLPKGNWINQSGEKIKGGQTISIYVPLDQIPIYTRSKQ